MDRSKLGNIAFSVVVMLIMIMISYTWGNFLMTFAQGTAGQAGLIIQIMITFVLLFGTFVVPFLIYSGFISNPFNVFLGIGSMLIGIPIIFIAVNVLGTIISIVGLADQALVVATFLTIMLIIIFGFIVPIIVMIQDESVLPIEGLNTDG